MSEISPGVEPSISKAIKQSAEYAFGPKPKEPQLLNKIGKVEQESRDLKEKLLGMVRTVAKEARNHGLDFGGIASSADRACAAAIWRTAQSRVEQRMQATALANPDLVLATLNNLDPIDVAVVNLNAKAGEPQRKVRRSVGLQPNARIKFVESGAQSSFRDNPQNPNEIILGGQAFAKDSVIRTLEGEGMLKPMWRRDGVSVPLINNKTGETFMVSLNSDQFKNLNVSLEGSPKTVGEKTIDIQEIKYGAHGLSSPDHAKEDDLGNVAIRNSAGEVVGLRFFSIDGSGGALKNTNIPEDQHPQKIIEKVELIKKSLQESSHVISGRTALRLVDVEAKADQSNPAYAGVVLVDVYKDRYDISRKGDHSVVRWSPQGFDHRRGEAWGPNRGDPSQFQSIDRPQNVAYALKSTGMGAKTSFLEEVPEANSIFSAVGIKGGVETVSVPRSDKSEYLLILSDGARGSGAMLDPNEKYNQEVNGIMTQLNSGGIDEKEAAKQIAIAARQIPGERDDISVQVVKLPPT